MNTFWTFSTANFTVTMAWDYDPDLDLSWDDTGEVAEGLNNGTYMGMVMRARVTGPHGDTLAEDYLGGCIYESPEAFRDHIGIRAQGENVGSYFSDMIRQACQEARRELLRRRAEASKVYVRAA